ncbi:PH domain-containing protein [Shewanella kaireitica]|uniref:PH domain-containing protein n=1 Tax=Shewanella kaireitica TaxID=212021 RepID=UPI00200C97A8|nr:PH domain-containing protein [Shewanella kaireitica]MCL1092760.1 PH domain-containing protein [Shewanella kaireitica]
MSNEMDDSHLENTTAAESQNRAEQPDNTASTQQAVEHAANTTHQLVAQAQWQGFEEVELQKVDERYYTQVLYESLFIALIGFIIASLATILPGALSVTYVILVITAVLLLMFTIGYLRHRQAQKLGYGVCEHEFLMEKGLWWHKRTSLPYSRLQHVSLSQGPLERHFNLFTLKCFSAGSGSAEIELPGIEQQTAEHLRQHLLAQAAKAHLTDPQQAELSDDQTEALNSADGLMTELSATNEVDLQQTDIEHNVTQTEVPDSTDELATKPSAIKEPEARHEQ